MRCRALSRADPGERLARGLGRESTALAPAERALFRTLAEPPVRYIIVGLGAAWLEAAAEERQGRRAARDPHCRRVVENPGNRAKSRSSVSSALTPDSRQSATI